MRCRVSMKFLNAIPLFGKSKKFFSQINQSSHFKGKRHSMLPCERLVPGSAGSQIRLQDVSIAVSHSDSN
jgi:hypothetical protein